MQPILAAFACLVAILPAQMNAPLTILDRNMRFWAEAYPASATRTSPVACRLTTSATGLPQLVSHSWHFRFAGDSREYLFWAEPNATRTSNGASMTTTWPDVDGRGIISAQLVQTVVSTGPGEGFLEERMTIRNIQSLRTARVSLFVYDNVLAGGQTDNWAHEVPDGHLVSMLTHRVYNRARGYTHTEASVVPALFFRLTDNVAQDLAGWTGWNGSTAADYCGAFQWREIFLLANATAVLEHEVRVPVRASSGQYGVAGAGSNGPPGISSGWAVQQPYRTSSPFDLELSNARGSAAAFLLTSLAPASTYWQGITFNVDLGSAVVFPHVTNASGSAALALTLPPATRLSGVSLYHQWLVIDPAALGGIAAHTRGLRQTIGD